MNKIKAIFPANRIALIVGLCLSTMAFLTSINESLVPGSPSSEAVSKAIMALGSVAAAAAMLLKFLDGSQKYDALIEAGKNADNKSLNTNVEIKS